MINGILRFGEFLQRLKECCWYTRVRCDEFLTHWATTLILNMGAPLVYILSLGIGLGHQITNPIDGLPYPVFVSTGAMAGTVVTLAGGFALWPVTLGFNGNQHFVAASHASLSPWQISLGETLAVGIRLLAQVLFFTGLGTVFQLWNPVDAALQVPMTVLAGLALYTPLQAFAARFPRAEVHYSAIYRGFSAIFLLGGAFTPVNLLPKQMQWFAWFSPVWHALLVNRAVLGSPSPCSTIHIVLLLLMFVLGSLCGCLAFRWRLMR